jgi:F-type H+-transporting ATPase subunit b
MSRTKSIVSSLTLGLWASGWVSTSAMASGGGSEGGAHHGAPHVANWWGIGQEYAETPALGWLFCTFAIFVVVLAFGIPKLGVPGVVPMLTKYLGTRADAVEKAIAEATKARDAALARAREAEAKFAALDQEVQKMKADFEVQGKAEAERIESAANEMAKKIAKDTEDMVAAEVDRARESLRAEASKIALSLAEERIRQMLTPTDDARLRNGLVKDLQA